MVRSGGAGKKGFMVRLVVNNTDPGHSSVCEGVGSMVGCLGDGYKGNAMLRSPLHLVKVRPALPTRQPSMRRSLVTVADDSVHYRSSFCVN